MLIKLNQKQTKNLMYYFNDPGFSLNGSDYLKVYCGHLIDVQLTLYLQMCENDSLDAGLKRKQLFTILGKF